MSDERCPDCGVAVGEPHDHGCDVARCLECGYQAIGHDDGHDKGDYIWTGEWPGDSECAEYGVGLNQLNDMGGFKWSREQQRWLLAAVEAREQ